MLDEHVDHLWGGMRNPKKISRELPGYRVAGHKVYQVLQQHLQEHPGLESICLQAIGSQDEEAGPIEAQQEQVAKRLKEAFADHPQSNQIGLHTKLRADIYCGCWRGPRATQMPMKFMTG